MSTTRVRYREQQTLRKSDLSDEQAYRIAMRRRHNLAHHTWGIVEGLELKVVADKPILKPGMAIDGYGRELFVTSFVSLEQAFKELGCENADVWLLYNLTPVTHPQRGRWDCGPGKHSRWREEAVLRLKPVDDSINPRKPVEVPEEDLGSGPSEALPDDPTSEWPVYLGKVVGNSVKMAGRPCAGLVGESVTAPSGKARMQVGSETVGDRRGFTVGVVDDDNGFSDRLVVDRKGDTSIHGNAILHENLVIENFEESTQESDPCAMLGRELAQPEIIPPPGIEFEPLDAEPEEAAPWQIYHVEVKSVEEEKKPSIHQLRLEIDNPGDKGDPSRNLLGIGYQKHNHTKFIPCLTVSADCTVTINGSLTVEGEVVESAIPADPDDPEFRNVMAGRWMQGIGETSAKLLTGYAFSELEIKINVEEYYNINGVIKIELIVTNKGHLPLSDVTVYGSIILTEEETTLIEPKKIGTLESREESSFEVKYTPTQTGTLTIIATVTGVTSTSAIISDWASATTSINGPYACG